MARIKERNKALELRGQGENIKDIARKLKIAKSTISLWCRDVKLTPEQIKRLHQKMIKGSYKGRLKGARIQYERRLQKIRDCKKAGWERLKDFSDRDFLIAGIALYWGEGCKKQRRVRFCNSDPEMIKFMIKWFKKVWNIDSNRFTLRIGINEIHKNRIKEVEKYWSRVTKISKQQFNKTTLIKAKNKKAYKDFSTHYGTLTVVVKKPSELYYKIIGLIDGLIKHGGVAQW